jgi:hypothetical protein
LREKRIMKEKMLYKTLVVGVIVLFIGLTFTPSLNADIINNENVSDTVPDLEITDIYPYYYTDSLNRRLCFSMYILVKLADYTGMIRVRGELKLFGIVPIEPDSRGIGISGTFKEGKTIIHERGYWMALNRVPPGIYSVSFQLYPEEPEENKLNNQLTEYYFIVGKFNLRAILRG